MAKVPELFNQHVSFACEVIHELNRFYNIPIECLQLFEEFSNFNNDIRWAIATISYLFRKDYFKIFSMLDKGLKNKKQFNEYCMLIPVKKNYRYFFNFLKRVSLIYEMTVYCYRNGNDYFLVARNCIALYEDKEYFFSAGSWSGLTETASFIRELGNTFLLPILDEITQEPLSFVAAVERIENRVRRQKNASVILNSTNTRFLIKQKEKFIARERNEKTKNMDLQVEKEKTFTKYPESTSCASSVTSANEVNIMSERKAIMDYLGSFLDPKVLNKSEKSSLEATKCEGSSVSKPIERLELKKSRTDTKSTEEYNYLTTNSAFNSSKKSTVDMHFRSNPSVDKQWKVAEDTHGSGDKHRIYPTSPSSSYFPTSSNNESSSVSKPIELLELRKSRTDTESTEEYDYLIINLDFDLSKKLTADMHFPSNPSVNEQGKVAEDTDSGDKHKIYLSSSSLSSFPIPSSNSDTEKWIKVDLSSINETLEAKKAMPNLKKKVAMSAAAQVVLNCLKQTTDTEAEPCNKRPESDDSKTTGKNSHVSSKPRQPSKGKGSRKNKGRKK